MAAPAILNIHTPTSSFAIVHSLTQDSLTSLYDKLSRKAHTDYHGERVGPGWLKYEYNDSIWNLDDESDYTIFIWRQQQELGVIPPSAPSSYTPSNASTSFVSLPLPGPSGNGFASPISTSSMYRSHQSHNSTRFYHSGVDRPTPTLYLHDPKQPLPESPAYRNPSYYLFQPSRAISPDPQPHTSSGKAKSIRSTKTIKKSVNGDDTVNGKGKAVLDAAREHQQQLKKNFEKFHGENGVRTVIGSIGAVQNVRMLLKSGYRHVYVSRKFAIKHGFIPSDSAPGQYGYAGLVSIGTWPITVMPIASSSASSSPTPTANHRNSTAPSQPWGGVKPTMVTVYLSEEPHFDVVLGRSFFEKRQIRMNGADPTEVVCLDTGERLECELVILKDGRGEFVTVT
ncbi:hypothetical protein BDN72DRAFT_964475 [Pluteus cervinus]|uniref:Uncharacterized protein n=1 Tax=Pluteus cervinus TaxID=181527 RepID=A0ACD3AA97_9AGAR|nr:hypothetical protein BDN72DRAFT_964475 [Pluteus cervinus]